MPQRVLRWKSLTDNGLEHCVVDTTDSSIRFRSVVIGAAKGIAFGLSYAMELDRDWTFRTLDLERMDGAILQLIADGKGNWRDGDGGVLSQLRGCIDIDLSRTPLTNTLPVRRNRLQPNVPKSADMAYVAIETLLPLRDGQIYTRLDAAHYRYQAADGSFEQVIRTDPDGFVVDYPTLFTRV